jgi:hypothetical protein
MATADERTTARAYQSGSEWAREEAWWRDNFRSRPYVREDRDFDHYLAAFRYGWEQAHRHDPGLGWSGVESDMMYGWNDSPHRAKDFSAWEEMKEAVRDAWQRVRGEPLIPHSRR